MRLLCSLFIVSYYFQKAEVPCEGEKKELLYNCKCVVPLARAFYFSHREDSWILQASTLKYWISTNCVGAAL